MATQNLEIIIGSNVGDAVKGLDQVDKATEMLSNDTNKAASSISKSYSQITAASKNLASSNNQLSKTVVNAGGTLTSFSRIVQDAPFGIIGVGNNITSFAEQFQFLQKQTGSAGGALKALAGSLAGAGGITLGISLLVTGITQLTQKYGSLGNAVDAILFPLNKQQQLQKSINDTLLEGATSAQKDVVQLDALYRAATNVNLPLDQRNKIVDELQKQYPEYLGNLSNEKILTGQAAIAYHQLRDAIVAKAQAQALSEKLAEIEGKRLPLLIEEQKLRQKLDNSVKAQVESEKNLNSLLSAGIRSKGAVESQDRLASSLVNSANAVKSVVAEIKENAIAQGDLNEESKAYAALQDRIINQFGAFAAGVTKVTKSIKDTKTISDILKELDKDITGLNVAFVAMGGSLTDLAVDKLQKFKRALQDVSELGVRPGDAVFKQLTNQVDLLQNSLSKTAITLKIPVNIQPIPAGRLNNTSFKAAVDAFNVQILTPFEKEITTATNRAIQSGVASIATGIGDAIGGLIGGGKSLQDAFNGIIGIFGGFIRQLGESMIAAGTAAIAAKLLIKNPYTAVAAGIIAVAAGAAIQASLSKYPSFATGGGVVGGPTLAMIGDNPGREEYVIPSEVLDSLGGGGAGSFVAETRISGTDLLVLVKRAGLNSNRANG